MANLGYSHLRSLTRLHSVDGQSWSHFEGFLIHMSGARAGKTISRGSGASGAPPASSPPPRPSPSGPPAHPYFLHGRSGL